MSLVDVSKLSLEQLNDVLNSNLAFGGKLQERFEESGTRAAVEAEILNRKINTNSQTEPMTQEKQEQSFNLGTLALIGGLILLVT